MSRPEVLHLALYYICILVCNLHGVDWKCIIPIFRSSSSEEEEEFTTAVDLEHYSPSRHSVHIIYESYLDNKTISSADYGSNHGQNRANLNNAICSSESELKRELIPTSRFLLILPSRMVCINYIVTRKT